MEHFAEPEFAFAPPPALAAAGTRVLCLGNELLADDAFGFEVARQIAPRLPREVEVVCSCASGFGLVEHVTGCSTLVIVDSIRSGASPGTVHHIDSESLGPGAADSPHRVGIMQVLKAAEKLGLSVPQRVTIYAVEAADVTTIGGAMDQRVHDAIAFIVDRLAQAFSGSPARPLGRAGVVDPAPCASLRG